MPFILALDEGTTSARAILFGQDGQIVASAQKDFRQIFPQPGWVEHDPYEIWECQCSVARQALQEAHLTGKDITAVGITNQRETSLLWDRESGEPVCNAIVWQDRRTAPMCDGLRMEGCENLIRERTGLVIDAYFSASKIAWMLDNIPGVRQLAIQGKLAFGTIDTWLVWKLTGGGCHVTDVSNASRTQLFNIHTGQWDEDLLELFRIPSSLMPKVCSSSELYGEIGDVEELEGIPIMGIAGDQQAALFGQLCLTDGLAKCTYGTGCFLLQNTGSYAVTSHHRLLTTIAWKLAGEISYALEGSVFIGGAVVQWLRDGLKIIRSSEEIEPLAASVPDSGGVYFVPAFAGLGAPHWDSYARGTLVGLTRGTTSAHIARAALESIAFQVADLLEAVHADAITYLTELRVDGGAACNNLLLQCQVDLLGVPVVRPVNTETTAAGAAFLAGLTAGVWKGNEDLAGKWRIDRRFEPTMSRTQAVELQNYWKRAVERAKGWEVE